jgi:hypothetical protein
LFDSERSADNRSNSKNCKQSFSSSMC